MGLCDFFLNALKIDCFIIKESKYPNYCYNNFLVPLAVDNYFLLTKMPAKICKVIRTLLVVADLLFNPIQTGGGAFRTPPPAKS